MAHDYLGKGNDHNAQTEFGAASVGRFVDGVLNDMRVSTAAELQLQLMVITTLTMEYLETVTAAQKDRDTAAIYRCMYNEARYIRQQIQELKANKFL